MFPKKLTDQIGEFIEEGYDVHVISDPAIDAYTWIVTPIDLDNWVIIVQWYAGNEGFEFINLQGRTLKYLINVNS